MKIRHLVLMVFWLCVCGLTGGLIHEHQKLQAVQAEQIEIATRGESLARELQRAKTRQQEILNLANGAEAQCKAVEQRLVDQETAEAAPVSAPKRANHNSYAEALAKLIIHDPEYQKMYMARQRTEFRAYYGRLYKQLGLTQQQIAAFENLIIAKQETSYDLMASMETQGLKSSDPVSVKALQTATKEMTDKLTTLIGKEGVDACAQYKKDFGSATAHGTATSLASALFYTETPLAVAQADQLVKIVDANTVRQKSKAETNWDTVLIQAEPVLSPEQLAMLKRQRESAQVAAQLAEIQRKLTAKPPGS